MLEQTQARAMPGRAELRHELANWAAAAEYEHLQQSQAFLQLGVCPGFGVEAGFQDRLPGRALLSVIERAALGYL